MHPNPLSPPLVDRSTSWRQELARLVRLSVPLVGANLLQMAIAAVDVMFVAKLGPLDLAAATLGAFLFNLLSYALIGLTSAAAPLMAAELGQRAHAAREGITVSRATPPQFTLRRNGGYCP